jgi:hypothetical protein
MSLNYKANLIYIYLVLFNFRVKALEDFGEDSSSDVAYEEEEEMEVHGYKHRKLTR